MIPATPAGSLSSSVRAQPRAVHAPSESPTDSPYAKDNTNNTANARSRPTNPPVNTYLATGGTGAAPTDAGAPKVFSDIEAPSFFAPTRKRTDRAAIAQTAAFGRNASFVTWAAAATRRVTMLRQPAASSRHKHHFHAGRSLASCSAPHQGRGRNSRNAPGTERYRRSPRGEHPRLLISVRCSQAAGLLSAPLSF